MPELEHEWEIVQLLPSLVLPKASEAFDDGWPQPWPGGLTLGSSVAAIVPPDDERVVAICGCSVAARALVYGCRNSADRPVRASLLVARKDAGLGMDALVDFRNAVAFTFLLRARVQATRSGAGSTAAWSDTWDFHPAFITDKDRLIVDTPAITEWYAEKVPFRAMPAPSVGASSERLYADQLLARAFAEVWQGYYQPNGSHESDPAAERLFRSLQVAYQASMVPVRHRASLHEFGAQAALWVSAMEILAWPKEGGVKVRHVNELLERAPLPSRREREGAGEEMHEPHPQEGSPVQRAYVAMYRVRNSFLHGDPVTWNDLTRERGAGRLNVHEMAAPVYRAALVGYLAAEDRFQASDEELSELQASDLFARADYADALDVALGDMVPEHR